MNNTRISRKDICTMIENINNLTNHIVKASFTDGCGTYLTIDGIEYKHIRRDGTGEGLTNKEIFKMLMKL